MILASEFCHFFVKNGQEADQIMIDLLQMLYFLLFHAFVSVFACVKGMGVGSDRGGQLDGK